MEEEVLIITPNATKMDMLEEIEKQKKLIPMKFMSIEEFRQNYFFQYDYRAISFIMDKYHIELSISKIYLNYLEVIDLDKNYSSEKLAFLQNIKKELIEKKLLQFNSTFHDYIKTKKIRVINYPKLEKYLVNVLTELGATFESIDHKEKEFLVYQCDTLFDEVTLVIEKIISLVKKGISLSKIFIVNMSDEYLYTIKRLFKLFSLPLYIQNKNSIITTLIVKEYLKNKTLPEVTKENEKVINQIIQIKNKLVDMEEDAHYLEFLKEELKNTYLEEEQVRECVRVEKLFERKFKDDEYVFLIGFNDLSLPLMYKDEDYITDNIKNEVALYTTSFKNERERELTYWYLANIKNLTISYKDRSFKDKYYPSSMIKDKNMLVEKYQINNYTLSHSFNKRMLAIYLEHYYKYKEENKGLLPLYGTYPDKYYDTYQNDFTGIDSALFQKYMKKIGLSYTSMNTYNLCKFRYYINYVLKLDPFEEQFTTFIGNLFHHVLEQSFAADFDFKKSWNEYLEGKEFLKKEEFFLEKLKKNLLLVLEVLNDQKLYSSFKEVLCEENISLPLVANFPAYFSGKIDKIMYKKEQGENLFAIIDYKTGGYDTDLYKMKYGIGMQLATYLYLIERSNIFEKPTFAGMYFQKVLPGSSKYDGKKSYLEKVHEALRLDGYSTDNEDVLSEFDHEYSKSKIIKGMKKTVKGTIDSRAKVLNLEERENIVRYTEQVINKTLEEIGQADFRINPKRMENKDISCEYCKFKDLCFKKEEDVEYLTSVKDLSFLEGDYHGE